MFIGEILNDFIIFFKFRIRLKYTEGKKDHGVPPRFIKKSLLSYNRVSLL